MSEEGGSVRSTTWISDFLKPINVISMLIGILGLFFAWYFYHKADKIAEVSWAMQKQIIFDAKSATPAIVVSDNSGQKITSDLYAAQIIVWNSGTDGLDNVDDNSKIRAPLVFSMDGDGRIVNASMLASKDTSASALHLVESEREVKITWKHFDTGSAFRMLILFTGNAQTSIKPDILIAGGKEIRSATYPAEIPEEHGFSKWFTMILGILFWLSIAFAAFNKINSIISPKIIQMLRQLKPVPQVIAFVSIELTLFALISVGIIAGVLVPVIVALGIFVTPIPKV